MHRQWFWPSVLEQLLLRQPLQQGHAQALMGAWRWEELAPVQMGVSGGPALQGAPVSLDLLPPVLQGRGAGYLRHRGDDAGTLEHFYGCGRDRCGRWGIPIAKHGNRSRLRQGGVSRCSGSLVGVNLKAPPAASLNALAQGLAS